MWIVLFLKPFAVYLCYFSVGCGFIRSLAPLQYSVCPLAVICYEFCPVQFREKSDKNNLLIPMFFYVFPLFVRRSFAAPVPV